MLIEDGTGGGYKAQVTSEKMVRTYAMVESEISHVSERHGDAYVWTATADWGGDKNAIWLRNNDTDANVIIQKIVISAPAAAVIEVYVGTGNTSGGTAITGVNMNRGSGKIANATCTHTNTNVDEGSSMTLLGTVHTGATPVTIDFEGALILAYYDEVALNIVTDVASTSINIMGYFHSPE